ncbi:hypothetical protein ACLKA7_016255 [Drosophila subpalustris]
MMKQLKLHCTGVAVVAESLTLCHFNLCYFTTVTKVTLPSLSTTTAHLKSYNDLQQRHQQQNYHWYPTNTVKHRH